MLFKTKLNVVNALKILSIFLSINVINVIKLKYKISDKVNLVYIVFIILAHFFGTIINLYDKVKYYDKLIHFIFGIAATYIILNIIKTKYKCIKSIIIVTFLATMWEIYEYIVSIIFGIDPQNNITTGVNDTMQDIIVALVGSLLYNIFKKY